MLSITALVVAQTIAGFDIKVENFTLDSGIAQVVLKVTNNTGKDARRVYIACTFLDKDQRAIDIGMALIDTLPAGAFAYEKGWNPNHRRGAVRILPDFSGRHLMDAPRRHHSPVKLIFGWSARLPAALAFLPCLREKRKLPERQSAHVGNAHQMCVPI